jgi:hypothetical protein
MKASLVVDDVAAVQIRELGRADRAGEDLTPMQTVHMFNIGLSWLEAQIETKGVCGHMRRCQILLVSDSYIIPFERKEKLKIIKAVHSGQ